MSNPEHGWVDHTGARCVPRRSWFALFAAGLTALACSTRSTESAGTAGGGGSAGTTGGSEAAGTSGTPSTGGSSGATGGSETAGTSGMPSAGGSSGATGGSEMAGTGGTATASDDYDVMVDPYGTNALVAVVNLRSIEASAVESVDVVVSGQGGGADFAKTYVPADPELAIELDTSDLTFPEPGFHVPIYGLYADRENTVRIRVERIDADPLDLTLPIATPLAKPDEDAWVPNITINTALPEQMAPGWTVAELNIEANPNPPIVFVEWTRSIAFDERGAIRWALRFDALPKGETFNRHLLDRLLRHAHRGHEARAHHEDHAAARALAPPRDLADRQR
jgi:hypothetical protein